MGELGKTAQPPSAWSLDMGLGDSSVMQRQSPPFPTSLTAAGGNHNAHGTGMDALQLQSCLVNKLTVHPLGSCCSEASMVSVANRVRVSVRSFSMHMFLGISEFQSYI